MRYRITPLPYHHRSVRITFEFETNEQVIHVSFPGWRPGRYEMANFAKNIRGWEVRDSQGNPVPSNKISGNQWKLETGKASAISITFEYHAAELNAGSTWVDDRQLYINPVNCLPYIQERIHESVEVQLDIPPDYQVATALEKTSPHTLKARDYHELADSPFIASRELVQQHFVYEGIQFHLWFLGIDKPDWSRLLNDFFLFTHEQYTLFGSFPVKNYHYLFQFVPYRLHHGVEHQSSTVIALGPDTMLNDKSGYNEFMSICSHELFHTWNVKAIRPAEMFPYDYSRENYSRLGYVYEGVTTYYGDLMLYRAQIFNHTEYFTSFNRLLNRHFDNPGRFHMAVADASFDTWLDGYVPGVPNRKTNIYNEGALTAFIVDILIRMHSEHKFSLDSVMHTLYHEFANKARGYTAGDYEKIVNDQAGVKLTAFSDLINGREDFRPYLEKCLGFLGLVMSEAESPKPGEALYGLRTALEPNVIRVLAVLPYSSADQAGLAPGDEIVAIDGLKVQGDFNSSDHLRERKLSFFRDQRLMTTTIHADRESGYRSYRVVCNGNAGEAEKANFSKWSGNRYPGKL